MKTSKVVYCNLEAVVSGVEQNIYFGDFKSKKTALQAVKDLKVIYSDRLLGFRCHMNGVTGEMDVEQALEFFGKEV